MEKPYVSETLSLGSPLFVSPRVWSAPLGKVSPASALFLLEFMMLPVKLFFLLS